MYQNKNQMDDEESLNSSEFSEEERLLIEQLEREEQQQEQDQEKKQFVVSPPKIMGLRPTDDIYIDLPPQKYHHDRFFKHFIAYRLSRYFLDMGASGCIGLTEGIASGCLTGLNASGAGGWIAGAVGQAFGGFGGSVGGGLAGLVVGLCLQDKNKIMNLFREYRESFGSNNARKIAHRSWFQ